jgi:hypothetical protein
LVDSVSLLAKAVRARIRDWDHPLIEERDEAAGELGLMLQEVVRQGLPQAVPPRAALDGLKELSAATDGDARLYIVGAFYVLMGNRNAMLPVQADLHLAAGALSTVRVADEAGIFDMATSERQFVRRMESTNWAYRLTLNLA